MKFIAVAGLTLLFALVLPAIAADTAPVHPDRIGFEISISPVDSPQGANPPTKRHFEITAVVRQLETGRVIFAPKVYALEGTPASVVQDSEDPRFSASFLIDGSTAKYRIERAQGAEKLASIAGTIQLTR